MMCEASSSRVFYFLIKPLPPPHHPNHDMLPPRKSTRSGFFRNFFTNLSRFETARERRERLK